MSHYDSRTRPTRAHLFAVVLAAWCAWATISVSSAWQEEGINRQGLVTSPDIDTTWRLTINGWQDSATWPAADSYTPKKVWELLHPMTWAGIVLISVIATMIWASSEWEVSRLFRTDADEESTHDPLQQAD